MQLVSELVDSGEKKHVERIIHAVLKLAFSLHVSACFHISIGRSSFFNGCRVLLGNSRFYLTLLLYNSGKLFMLNIHVTIIITKIIVITNM